GADDDPPAARRNGPHRSQPADAPARQPASGSTARRSRHEARRERVDRAAEALTTAERQRSNDQGATSALGASAHAHRSDLVDRRGNVQIPQEARALTIDPPPRRAARRRTPVLRPTRRLPVAAVVEAPRLEGQTEIGREARGENEKGEKPRLGHVTPPSRPLEPDILECLRRAAVEVRCKPVVATARRKIATGDPCSCAMAGRAELREIGLRRAERLVRLVEAILLEQGPPEHKLRVADLVEVVLVARGLEETERVTR